LILQSAIPYLSQVDINTEQSLKHLLALKF